MADRGDIARCLAGPAVVVVQRKPIFPRILRAITTVGLAEQLAAEARRDDSEGSSAPPSLYLPKGGRIRLRIPIAAGSRAVTVKARQPSAGLPRPTARILTNAAIGLNADLTAAAPAGTGWVSIGPLTFNATANGGVEVELFAPWSGGISGCWFDALTVA